MRSSSDCSTSAMYRLRGAPAVAPKHRVDHEQGQHLARRMGGSQGGMVAQPEVASEPEDRSGPCRSQCPLWFPDVPHPDPSFAPARPSTAPPSGRRRAAHTGRTDLPLTDAGRAQCHQLAPLVRRLLEARAQPPVVFTSGLQRANETAHAHASRPSRRGDASAARGRLRRLRGPHQRPDRRTPARLERVHRRGPGRRERGGDHGSVRLVSSPRWNGWASADRWWPSRTDTCRAS